MELNLLHLIDNSDVTKQDVIIILNFWQKHYGGKGLFGIVKKAESSLYLLPNQRYVTVELKVYEPFETGEGKLHTFTIYYSEGVYVKCYDRHKEND